MINFQKFIGNLYLACLFFQITHFNIYNHNHKSTILKSIDNVINDIYFSDNQIEYYQNNTQDVCYKEDVINISIIIYSVVEYYAIFFISVITLEFMMIQNIIHWLFISVCVLSINYSILWKQLFNIWNIDYYHEHIWLGFATISFTVLSNSLKNTKNKRNDMYKYVQKLNVSFGNYKNLYNYLYVNAIACILVLCIISNQYILLFTLLLYIANLILCPHYVIFMFEISSIMYICITQAKYYNLAILFVYYVLFTLSNMAVYNIVSLLCIKTIGIFFNNIYVNFLCKY